MGENGPAALGMPPQGVAGPPAPGMECPARCQDSRRGRDRAQEDVYRLSGAGGLWGSGHWEGKLDSDRAAAPSWCNEARGENS